MNRRTVLGAVGGIAGAGLAGCSTCGDCFSPFRSLGLAVRPDGWATTPTGTAGDADAGVATGRSQAAWPVEVRITNRLYKTDRPPFGDVAVIAYDRGGERLHRVTVGDVSVENGFVRETRDGSCCGGTFVTYERKWVRLDPEQFPRYVALTATVERCDPRRDEFAYATYQGGTDHDYNWRDCDRPLPFRPEGSSSSDEE